MTGRLSVQARGHDVVLELDDRFTILTPQEAQRFAFDLARAYMRAGEMSLSRTGTVALRLKETRK
jgi:hypothetical protein